MRNHLLTAFLILFGLLIAAGQYLEHRSMAQHAEAALEHRAQDLAAAFSVVIRSQGRGAHMSRDRLEDALINLVHTASLESVVLLDESGNVVAEAGTPLELDPETLLNVRVIRSNDKASYANLIALGPESDSGARRTSETAGGARPGMRKRRNMVRNPVPPPGGTANRFPLRPRPFAPGPPRWMSHEEYDRLVQSQGIHWFLVTMSIRPMQKDILADLVLRLSITGAAWVACAALAAAWRSQEKTAHLAVALIGAEDAATRLQEMNTTAAGLMHETKNPLNIIRGSAQMIEQDHALPARTRTQARTITEEADRITGRLNQFLSFARPQTQQIQSVAVKKLAEDILSILNADREEKNAVFFLSGPDLNINADEGMLRQMLFNLIHNALQAIDSGGQISVELRQESDRTLQIDITDSGPGIPAEQQEEIFQPYVSHFDGGTGLGLSIVRRLADAQGWEVRCIPAEEGAHFRISGITLSSVNIGGAHA